MEGERTLPRIVMKQLFAWFDRRLGGFPRQFREYLRWVGWTGAIRLASCDLLQRPAWISVRIADEPITLRGHSSDFGVAITCLSGKEYRDIRCFDPAVIVDLGANIGASALYFARRYPDALVIALEPEAANYTLLEANTRHRTNVQPVRAAIWNTPGHKPLNQRPTGSWGYTITQTHDTVATTEQQVECMTVDGLMKQFDLESIDILKMDIEGAEKEVLDHCAAWIDRVQVLSVELHDRIVPGCSDAFRQATRGFVEFEQHGEKITAYAGPLRKPLRPRTPAEGPAPC